MSQQLLTLLLGGTVASSALLALLALVVFRETRRTLAFDQRLGVARARALACAPRTAERSRAAVRGARGLGLAFLRVASVLAPVGAPERAKLARLLRRAGFANPDTLSFFLSIKLGAGAMSGAAAGYLAADSATLGQHGLLVAFAAVAALVAGSMLPEYAVRVLAARRLRRMAATLPDALDLMVMCLESGLSFERGLSTVAEELMPITPGLAAEFRLLEAELRLGASRRAVLQEFQERTDVEGLKDLAMTLIQAERYGTPLTQSLKNIAAEERLRRAARIATQAERLPVLMTLPTLLMVMPGTMCLVAGPAFLTAIDALRSLGGG